MYNPTAEKEGLLGKERHGIHGDTLMDSLSRSSGVLVSRRHEIDCTCHFRYDVEDWDPSAGFEDVRIGNRGHLGGVVQNRERCCDRRSFFLHAASADPSTGISVQNETPFCGLLRLKVYHMDREIGEMGPVFRCCARPEFEVRTIGRHFRVIREDLGLCGACCNFVRHYEIFDATSDAMVGRCTYIFPPCGQRYMALEFPKDSSPEEKASFVSFAVMLDLILRRRRRRRREAIATGAAVSAF